MSMELSFICINFRSYKLVKELFNSLCPLLKEEGVTYEAIIIDQSEDDQEREKLQTLSIPSLRIASLPNHGFGKGCNYGASLARGRYLCFLNPDLILKKFDWESTLNVLKNKGPDIMAGARLYLPNGSLQVSTWWFPTVITEILRRIANRFSEKGTAAWNSFLRFLSRKPRKVPWITGALFIIPRSTFFKLDGFDESFFLYFEDIDLCYRAKKKGILRYWLPFIEATHLESAITKKNYQQNRNRYRNSRNHYWKKHYSSFSCHFLRISEKLSDLPFLR